MLPNDFDCITDLDAVWVAVDDVDQHAGACALRAIEVDDPRYVGARRGKIRVQRVPHHRVRHNPASTWELDPLDVAVLAVETIRARLKPERPAIGASGSDESVLLGCVPEWLRPD